MSFRDELGLEVEVAVIRGQEWVYRGIFRPPAMISVGVSPSAVLTVPGSNLPDHHVLIRIHSDGGALYFQPGMAVELRLAEGIKRNDELLDEGLATAGTSGWKVPLGKGSKGAFRVAEVSVLFKVRFSSTALIKAVKSGRPALCGSCGTSLQYAIVGFGALTPCPSCKTLNEVQPEGDDPERRLTQLALVVKRPAELPTFDAISATRAPEVTPAQRLAQGRLSDLPTFDAISVQTARAPEPPPREAEEGDLAAPAQRTPIPAEPPSTPPRPKLIPRGAELPTFDAISVMSKEELSNLHAAPTPKIEQLTGGAPTAEEVESLERASEVEAVSEEEDDFFFGESPVSLELQRSYHALPVVKSGASEGTALGLTSGVDDPVPNPDFADRSTRQVLVLEQRVEQAETIDEMEAGPPSAFVGGVPAEGREPAPPRTIVPPFSGAPTTPEANRTALSSTPPGDQSVPSAPGTTEAHSPPRDGEDGSDLDDFLMGRVSIPDASPVVDDTNRWLTIIGVVSGLLGLALIVYKVVFD